MAYLANETDLDFAVKCGGCGSVSAKDVLISMAAFNGVEFDESSRTVVVGAGQTWGDVDRKMEGLAPGYAGMMMCFFFGTGTSLILEQSLGRDSRMLVLVDRH